MRFHRSLLVRLQQVEGDIETVANLAAVEQGAGGVSETAKLAKAKQHLESQLALAELREDARAMEEYAVNAGARDVAQFKAVGPELEVEIAAIPTEMGSGMHATLVTGSNQDLAAKLLGDFALHAGGEQSYQGALDRAYATLNKATLDKDAPDVEDPPKVSRKCGCAGMCLCTPVGKALVCMRESFHTVCLKPEAPAHSDARVRLKEGRWCCVLRGVPFPVPEDIEEDDCLEIIWHIAYMVLSPWRPTWHLVRRTDAPAAEPPTSDRRMYTQVLGQLR